MATKTAKVASTRSFPSKACVFCGMDEDDEFLYGKYLQSDDICCHSNCMFFSSGLEQSGEEHDGFYGFILPDIELEVLRGKKLTCAFCHKKGATVGCVNSKCRKSFHFPCGIQHNTLHEYFGSFNSYCKDHSPKQSSRQTPDDLCCQICFNPINPDLDSWIYSPCCANSCFHRFCMQKYASSAGLHFFRCPLCKNSEVFVKEMTTYGIYVPDKDAEWELEDNAYQELLVKPECNATPCRCTKGRKYNPSKNSIWTLLPCFYCGAQAQHRACAKKKLSARKWLCTECQSFDQKVHKKKTSDSDLCSSKTQVKADISSVESESASHDIDFVSQAFKELKPLRIFCTRAQVPVDHYKINQESNAEHSGEKSFKEKLPHKEASGCNLTDPLNKNSPMDANSNNLKNLKLYEKDSTSLSNGNFEEILRDSRLSEDIKNIPLNELDMVKKENSNSEIFSRVGKDETEVRGFSSCSLNAFSKLRSPTTSLTVKKVKRKIEHTCSKDKLCCLKKYFKNENGMFRL